MQDPVHKHRHRRTTRNLEDSGKRGPFRKIESVISKYFFRFIGIIFILASIWYAVSSAGKILNITKTIVSKETVLQPKTIIHTQPVTPLSGAGKQILITAPMIIWVTVIAIVVVIAFFLAGRFRRKEIGRIAILIFYPALVLLARNFGWQVHLLFPLILLFSVLLYRNGMRLRTTIAIKINVLMAWSFFGIWWILNVILEGQNGILFPYLLYSGIFFCWFTWAGIRRGYSGYHKSFRYMEFIVVLVNISFYYLLTTVVFYKFGFTESLWLFALALSLLLFGTIYFSDKFRLQFNKIPYIIAGIILMSLVVPLLYRKEILLLFSGCLSALLLLYAKISGDRASVIISLISLMIMILIFIQYWILKFLPVAFFQNILANTSLVNKGIFAGLAVTAILIIDHKLLKETDITFPQNWFKRRTYLRIIKGVILLTAFLTGIWIFNYACLMIIGNDDAKFLGWFCFSCLYFIGTLPVLSKQKSSYLKPFIWFSLFLIVTYPGLIHFTVVEIRNESLRLADYSRAGFKLHYFASFLIISNLWLTGSYFTRIYKDKRMYLHGFWTFLVFMLTFLTLSEMDHLTVITGLHKGISIEDIILRNRQLPYTVISVLFSGVILAIGFVRRSRFLRALGLIMLAMILIKFLYLDLRSVGGTGKTILLFAAGIVVIIISFYYSRIRTYFHYRDSGHHHHHRHLKEGNEGQSKKRES